MCTARVWMQEKHFQVFPKLTSLCTWAPPIPRPGLHQQPHTMQVLNEPGNVMYSIVYRALKRGTKYVWSTTAVQEDGLQKEDKTHHLTWVHQLCHLNITSGMACPLDPPDT